GRRPGELIPVMIIPTLLCFAHAHWLFLFIFACCLCLAAAIAVDEPEGSKQRYQMPPRAVADLIDAPVTPAVTVSPDREWLLLLELPSLPPIAELARP